MVERENEIDLVRAFKDAFEQEIKDLGKVNIILAGKTGVGKSSLLNAVFKEDLAETGVGQPITQEMKEYCKEGGFYHLFDTKGFEVGRYEEIKNDVLGKIDDKANNSEDPNEHIHIMWYCINDKGKRIEPEEIKFIKSISEKIPVVVVLTQSVKKKDVEFFKEVEKELFDVSKVKVVRVLALDEEFDDEYCVRAYGVEELVEIVHGLLPECAKTAYVVAQKVSKRLRAVSVREIIEVYSIAAAKECVTNKWESHIFVFAVKWIAPSPIFDYLLRVPDYCVTKMLTKISSTYSLVLPDGFVESKILPAVASLFSEKMFVSWLRMLLAPIPMVGKIVGDKLASEIVEKIIRRIGEAYYNVLERYCEEPDLAPESFEEIFKEQIEKICQSN